MTYLGLNKQSTNREHPHQLVNYTNHKRLVIVHTRQFVTRLLMQVYMYFSSQPVDSYQLEIINAKKRFSFVTLQRIALFS